MMLVQMKHSVVSSVTFMVGVIYCFVIGLLILLQFSIFRSTSGRSQGENFQFSIFTSFSPSSARTTVTPKKIYVK